MGVTSSLARVTFTVITYSKRCISRMVRGQTACVCTWTQFFITFWQFLRHRSKELLVQSIHNNLNCVICGKGAINIQQNAMLYELTFARVWWIVAGDFNWNTTALEKKAGRSNRRAGAVRSFVGLAQWGPSLRSALRPLAAAAQWDPSLGWHSEASPSKVPHCAAARVLTAQPKWDPSLGWRSETPRCGRAVRYRAGISQWGPSLRRRCDTKFCRRHFCQRWKQ